MELRFGGARYSAMTAIGYELDGIGELNEVNLPRQGVEDDQTYRERLIVKLDWLCGSGKPVNIGMADFGKYRLWLEQSTPVEIDGLQYLVQSVSFENGRAGAWLMPAVPLEILAHEWKGPAFGATRAPEEYKPDTSVRDAVRNHW
jgi:hypothetical protein